MIISAHISNITIEKQVTKNLLPDFTRTGGFYRKQRIAYVLIYWIEPVPALKSKVTFAPAPAATASWSPPSPRKTILPS